MLTKLTYFSACLLCGALAFCVFPLCAQQTISFSSPGGSYPSSFQLELNANDSLSIYYTLDGSLPSTQSQAYTQAISINEQVAGWDGISYIPTSEEWQEPDGSVYKATIVRAQAYNGNKAVGPVYTQTYFINKKYSLPLVSVVTAPENLFDEVQGIYVVGQFVDEFWGAGNFYARGDWSERLAHLEIYMPDGSSALNEDIRIRITGNSSRAKPQKSLRLYAMPDEEFDYPLFEDYAIDEFDKLVLRNLNGDWGQSAIADPVSRMLASNGFDVEYQQGRPVIVFMNGEYWGIHFLTEYIDEHYLDEKFDLKKSDILLIENQLGMYEEVGLEFPALLKLCTENDLSIAANYDAVSAELDISSTIDFAILGLYTGMRHDWVNSNVKYWKPSANEGKWRWIWHDGDGAFRAVKYDLFGLLQNELEEEIIDDQAVFARIFMALWANESFRQQFEERLHYQLNKNLKPETLQAYIDELQVQLAPEMAEHINRWHYPTSLNKWKNGLKKLRQYSKRKPNFIRNYAANGFSYSAFRVYAYLFLFALALVLPVAIWFKRRKSKA